MDRPSGEGRRRCARLAQRVAIPLVLFGTIAAPVNAATEPPDLAWIDRAALAAGEVLVVVAEQRRSEPFTIRVATRVDASPEAVFTVLAACEQAPEYTPHVRACRRLAVSDDGNSETFVQTVKPAFFLPSFEHVFRLDYDRYRRIDVRRVSGPIDTMTGTWWLLDAGDGALLLVYELAIDPGPLVPRIFVRATLQRDLPRILAAIRDRATVSRAAP